MLSQICAIRDEYCPWQIDPERPLHQPSRRNTGDNWTIMGSAPPGIRAYGNINNGIDFSLALVEVVQDYLVQGLRAWDAIINHIEGLLAEGHFICSPREHDRLLVDDENLTRSRKYFWIITSIDEFTTLLNRTVEAMEEVHEEHLAPRLERAVKHEDRNVRRIKDLQRNRKHLSALFEKKKSSGWSSKGRGLNCSEAE